MAKAWHVQFHQLDTLCGLPTRVESGNSKPPVYEGFLQLMLFTYSSHPTRFLYSAPPWLTATCTLCMGVHVCTRWAIPMGSQPNDDDVRSRTSTDLSWVRIGKAPNFPEEMLDNG